MLKYTKFQQKRYFISKLLNNIIIKFKYLLQKVGCEVQKTVPK